MTIETGATRPPCQFSHGTFDHHNQAIANRADHRVSDPRYKSGQSLNLLPRHFMRQQKGLATIVMIGLRSKIVDGLKIEGVLLS